jgi:hypothetical protein
MSVSKGSVGGSVAMMVTTPFLSILHGWALTMLWRWFVVPTFHVAQLGIVPAIGLGLVVAMFMPNIPSQNDEKDENPNLTLVLMAVIKPLILLGVGALWHSCQ